MSSVERSVASAYVADMPPPAKEDLDRLQALIAARVSQLQEERGWKQQVLADAMGTNQAAVSKMLKGRKDGSRQPFSLSHLRALATLFGVPMAHLLPSDRELQTGKLEPLESTGLEEPVSVPRPNLRPQLGEFLLKHGRDIPPRAREALELSNPLPGEGENADEFYWRLVSIISVGPPRHR